MSNVNVAMIFNEPPFAEVSAAGRSYEAMLRSLIQSEKIDHNQPERINSHCGTQFVRFFANDTPDGNGPQLILERYPELSGRFLMNKTSYKATLTERVRNHLWPMSFHASRRFRNQVEQSALQAQADLLHIEQTWMAYAVANRFKPDRVLMNVHYLMATDESVAEPPGNLKEAITRGRLLRTEQKLLSGFKHFRVLSNELADSIKRMHPDAQTHVIPLPIDATSYDFRPREKKSSHPIVTLIGSMFWPPSRRAGYRLVMQLWPQIKAAVPEARLQIVGRDARRYFSQFDQNNGISVFENVPEIEPFFHQSSVMLYAPEAGSGMKVKIQEAMLYGLPVVTNLVGVEGLNARHRQNVMLGQTDEELVESTVELLLDQELATKLSHQGRAMIQQQCNPDKIMHQLSQVYKRMMNPCHESINQDE